MYAEDRPMQDAMDLNRFYEVKMEADLGANLWQSLMLAADRGDDVSCRMLCQQIQAVTKSTFALVRSLGKDDPNG